MLFPGRGAFEFQDFRALQGRLGGIEGRPLRAQGQATGLWGLGCMRCSIQGLRGSASSLLQFWISTLWSRVSGVSV